MPRAGEPLPPIPVGLHLLVRVQTGHGTGADGQPVVHAELWAHDLGDQSILLGMFPHQADQLADALKDSARKARAALS